MIRSTEKLELFERREAVARAERGGFSAALQVFTALWREAVSLNEGFPSDWREDVEADVELARVLNGLPSRP